MANWIPMGKPESKLYKTAPAEMLELFLTKSRPVKVTFEIVNTGPTISWGRFSKEILCWIPVTP